MLYSYPKPCRRARNTHMRAHTHTVSGPIANKKYPDQRLEEHKRTAGHEWKSKGSVYGATITTRSMRILRLCTVDNTNSIFDISWNDATTANSYWQLLASN